MNIAFATITKRINSTLVPQSFTQLYQCILKDDCSVLSPVISLDVGLVDNPSSYNYAHMPSFNRYYYIKDWTFSNRLWHATMEVDVLASHKSDILESNFYVARCSKLYDGNIIDTLYPSKVTFNEGISYWNNGLLNSPWVHLIDSGTYIVGLINSDLYSMGAVSYYAFTPAQFSTLKNTLMSDATWTDILTTNPDIGLNLYKSLFDPFQYFASINWFPFNAVGKGTLVDHITVGWWTLNNINCYRISSFIWDIEQDLTFEPHGQASTKGNYLNTAPYSTYILAAPPFGEIELDASKFAMAEYENEQGHIYGKITCSIKVDIITGSATLSVYVNGDEDIRVLYINSQVSVPIQLAQLYAEHNIGDTIATTINAGVQEAKTFATGIFNDPVGTMKELKGQAKLVTDALSVGTTHLSQIGSNGSLAQFAFPFMLRYIHRIVVDEDNDDFGRPYCKEVELSYLSPGFVQTVNAHVMSNAYKEEAMNINMYLDGGVYLE